MSDYFAKLERELVAAAEREQHSTAQGPVPDRSRRQRRHRLVLATLAAVLATGVSAAAVSGVFWPHRESDGLVRLSERRVAAEGHTADGAGWQLLVSRSDAGLCLGFRRMDAEMRVSEGCGRQQPDELSVATISGGDRPSNAIAYGMTPASATHVRIVADDVELVVPTTAPRFDLPGRLYVGELPTRRTLGFTKVTALDATGHDLVDASIGRG